MLTKREIPLLGVAASVPLLWLATAHYPGGNDEDPTSVGFRFADNYVCALSQPLAINGLENTARIFAVPAFLLLCASMAYMYWAISRACSERATRKTIEIFGIGAMVYAFLGISTPMHDLLVKIAAISFGLAAIGMLRMLYASQRRMALPAGLICLALLTALAAMRHGNFRPDLAPLTEWLLFASAALWLTCVYYSVTAPNNAVEQINESSCD